MRCYNYSLDRLFFIWVTDLIICVCRNIKESDFETKEEMIQRIMQLDHNCGQCQEYVQKLKELLYEVE